MKIILFIFILLSAGSALTESLTFDEPAHIQMGLEWYQGIYTTDPYNATFVHALQVLPLFLNLLPGGIQPNVVYFFPRMVTVLFALGVLILTYRTARTTGGRHAGLISASILAFLPVFFAHSHYLTLDVPYAFILLLFIREFIHHGTSRIFRLGILAGFLALVRVPSLVFIIPVYIYSLVKNGIVRTGMMGVLFVLTVWAGYGFSRAAVVQGLPGPDRVSERIVVQFPSTRTIMYTFRNADIPLGNYLASVKNTILRSGKTTAWFFEGEVQKYRWYFWPVQITRTLPMPFLFFGLAGVVYLLMAGSKQERIIAAVPVFMFFVFILSRTPPLVRYFIPALPFMAVAASYVVVRMWKGVWRIGFVGAAMWYMWSFAGSYPSLLPYANELAGPASERYRILSDSNLDWGQGLPELKKYLNAQFAETVLFSYFGRDDAALYGFESPVTYGSYIHEDICAFHPVGSGEPLYVIISVSNWWGCGYHWDGKFAQNRIREVVADSFLVFDYEE